MLDFRLKLRIFWITMLAAVVLVLACLYIVPAGKITYLKISGKDNDFIGDLTPASRVNGPKIIGDPVYFSLRTPRRFEEARLTFKYKNNDPALPIIEAGVSKDGRTWQYDLQPLLNKKIEELSGKWNVLQDGGTMLLQRNKKYDSVQEFINNPPNTKEFALYNYNFAANFVLPGYESAKATTTICRPLAGAYQFYTYLKKEKLFFDFAFQDLNKNSEPDPIDVYVYYGEQQIAAEHLADASSAFSGLRHLKLELANLPEGAYRIYVRAGGDIITRTIATAQSKMAFINTLSLAEAPEVSCGRNLFTNSRSFKAQTSHPAKLQKIIIKKNSGGEEDLDINETYKLFEAKNLPAGGNEIILQNDGLALSGDGLFSFASSSLFDPRLKQVGIDFNADQEDVDYVLARYAPPVREGEWLVSAADFDLRNSFRAFNKNYFMISIPGLRADDNLNDGIEIKEIRAELKGVSLWEKIKKILKPKNCPSCKL